MYEPMAHLESFFFIFHAQINLTFLAFFPPPHIESQLKEAHLGPLLVFFYAHKNLQQKKAQVWYFFAAQKAQIKNCQFKAF